MITVEAAPELSFAIEGAEALEYAAVPTLRFRLRIESAGGAEVASIALNAQVRIAVRRRSYDALTRERLAELLGSPGPEGGSIRSLFWTQATTMVPPFGGATTVELDVPCTYDFEVAVAKYFHALEDGEVPLEFLFSGSVFYPGPGGGLRVGRIPWDREASYRFPVGVWQALMERHFPQSAWLRLRRDTFDRLHTFRARRVLPGWEEAIEELLRAGEKSEPSMSTEHLEQVARTLLYEGYLLWPYRRSAIKNRRRWTIGGVYPPDFEGAAGSGDAAELICECLLEGDAAPVLELRVRFLHRVMRQVSVWDGAQLIEVDELQVGAEHYLTWDEAAEREVRVRVDGVAAVGDMIFPIAIHAGRKDEWLIGPDGERAGALVRSWEALEGLLEISVTRLDTELGAGPGNAPGHGLYRVRAHLRNRTSAAGLDREAALGHTFIAAHLALEAVAGEFVSLLEPPAALAEAASSCRNVGCWPVLVGVEGERHTMLASPVICYDYPQIAPESPGDLFDGTEIDQLLILNVLGLTDAEKAEVRASDPRAREILERSESLGPEEMLALFGAIRDYREVEDGEI